MNGIPSSSGNSLQKSDIHLGEQSPVKHSRSSSAPAQLPAAKKMRGSRIGKLLHPRKKLPAPAVRRHDDNQPKPVRLKQRSILKVLAQSLLKPQPIQKNTAEGVLSSLGQYCLLGPQGGEQLYNRLTSPDISYQEVRKLAWDYQDNLPPELNQTAKIAWSVRKAMTELDANPDTPAASLKQSLTGYLRQRLVPEMFIHQAMRTIDFNRPDEVSQPPVQPVRNQPAARQNRHHHPVQQPVQQPIQKPVRQPAHRPAQPAGPHPIHRPPGSALTHTPSLSKAEAVHLKEAYGVTAVPITLRGKPVAYLFTRTPDKPKENVLLSCHGAAWENRPKVTKPDDMTIRFAAPKDKILHSSTTQFADAFASGHTRFDADISQLYRREKADVTDYYLEGSINTTPEQAAAQLAKLDQRGGAVNEFDYLLLDRNVKNLHFSDLMEAMKESGIHPKQMINHHCRPMSRHSGGFNALNAIDPRSRKKFTSDN